MGTAVYRTGCFALAVLLAGPPSSSPARPSRDKTVWNYDGGILFETEGSLPSGPCFRIRGHVTSAEFFNDFKRVDDDEGTVFLRGTQAVKTFPDAVLLSFAIRDERCSRELWQTGGQRYLTREMMSTVRFSLFWKRGLHLRPVSNARPVSSAVEPLVPFAKNLAAELPRRFEWSWELAVPSAGVPLTDSLVLVFSTPDGRIAARVAARL